MPPDAASPIVHVDLLPYSGRLEHRSIADVDLVVIHCTELPDLATARRFGEDILYPETQTGNSGHYYIDRDGATHRYIPDACVAHHTRGYNPRSIGIELVNTGRYPAWLDSRHQAMDEAYPDPQVHALIALLHRLQDAIPSLRWIAGHEDLDTTEVAATDDASRMVRRKRDPGPLFPWPRVLDAIRLRRLPV